MRLYGRVKFLLYPLPAGPKKNDTRHSNRRKTHKFYLVIFFYVYLSESLQKENKDPK